MGANASVVRWWGSISWVKRTFAEGTGIVSAFQFRIVRYFANGELSVDAIMACGEQGWGGWRYSAPTQLLRATDRIARRGARGRSSVDDYELRIEPGRACIAIFHEYTRCG